LEGAGFLEGEGEYEGEGFLGAIAQGLGSLLGEGEGEGFLEGEFELEGEGFLEGEYEQEQFFGKAFRSIGRFVKKNAPMLKGIARIAAPLVATAVGGPAAGALARKAVSFLREGELEFELEGEFEGLPEGELEFEAHFTQNEAVAEQMANFAAMAQTEMESEAMAGAATAISARDRAELRRVLPYMVRGTAILTRILRRRPNTRPLVRAVPTIVRNTNQTLMRRAAAGKPVNRRVAGQVMAAQTQRVLGNPHRCASALRRNVRATSAASRANRRSGARESQFAP
jgi:hypothetical protein